jgi:D-sedoheptulose 7-phosphate isomerase
MKENYKNYIENYFKETTKIIDSINVDSIASFVDLLQEAKDRGGRLFIFGVGGSAANASHAVNDFRKIFGIECYTPTDNVAELTARINDEGWSTSFVEWLKVSKFNSNDISMILSVGGGSVTTSQNLVEVMKYTRQKEGNLISIVSRDGGIAKQLSDCCVHIPVVAEKRITPHAEEWQGIIWHLVVNCLMSKGMV